MFGGGKNQYNYLPLLGLFVLQMLQFCKFGSIYLIFFMRMKDFDFGCHQPIFGINIISIGIYFFVPFSNNSTSDLLPKTPPSHTYYLIK